MNDKTNHLNSSMNQGGRFTTTRWSVVLAAGSGDSPAAKEALELLCKIYWKPICTFLKCDGNSREDAEDFTQGFFVRFLERNDIAGVNHEKGRFRTFLLVALRNYVSEQRKRARAQKRGGGKPHVSLDDASDENGLRFEPADYMDAERCYERDWAITVLQQTATRLEKECCAKGKAALYEALMAYEMEDHATRSYAKVAEKVGKSASAVKADFHRIRCRHQELLQEEVANTVSDPAEIADELRYLLGVISK